MVHIDDIFAVGKVRCDPFGRDLNQMVPDKMVRECVDTYTYIYIYLLGHVENGSIYISAKIVLDRGF